MEAIRIRRGIESDALALAAFAACTFTEAFAAGNRQEDLRIHIASSYGPSQQVKELTDSSVITLLAERRAALVAYAQIRRQPPPGRLHEETVAQCAMSPSSFSR